MAHRLTHRRICGIRVLLCMLVLAAVCSAACAYSTQHVSVPVNGRTLSLHVARLPLNEYRVRVGLAHGGVGSVESLASIAARYGAVAAINGCFFEAYTSSPTKAPNHHVIAAGELVHLGNVGTTLGFSANGDYRMERVRLTIRGGLDGTTTWPGNWYAYVVNRPIQRSSSAAVYTSAWAEARTPGNGTSVLVRNGRVESVARGSMPRPADGFVLVLTGEEQRMMADRFRVGRQVSSALATEASDHRFWETVTEALGAGPRLVADGQLSVNPEAEGFSDPKILSASCRRSAVGITRDRALLLVTCESATIRQLAQAMLALGAHDAMNLDGGASSGLWADGRYLTSPGRNISNALVVLKRQ